MLQDEKLERLIVIVAEMTDLTWGMCNSAVNGHVPTRLKALGADLRALTTPRSLKPAKRSQQAGKWQKRPS